jgi:ketosteroid isomerase-like protein
MWSRTELEEAFQHYLRTVEKAVESGDWSLFANLFTDDATYIEHMYGTFHGRPAILDWISKTMGSFPGSAMTGFPPTWSVVDEERGRIICELENHMPDPGDGSVHQATNVTILTYAGDNLWSCEEDVYNPAKFVEMVGAWRQRSIELGTLSDEAAAFFGGAR